MPPKESGNLTAPHSPPVIKGRYDAKTFADFESWARKTDLGDGRTVWSWLEGAETAAAGATSGGGVATGAAAATVAGMEKALLDRMISEEGGAPVSAEKLAAAVAAKPDHPVAKDLRLWSEDKETFNHFKWDDTPDAVEWRKRMDSILLRIRPEALSGKFSFVVCAVLSRWTPSAGTGSSM